MPNSEQDALTVILLSLTEKLLQARQQKDKQFITDLTTTTDILEDICIENSLVPLARVLGDLRTSGMDAAIGEEFKSHIPTQEEIEKAVFDSGAD